jgi:hypothetical protein
VACEAAAVPAANDDQHWSAEQYEELAALRAIQQRFQVMAPGRTPAPDKAFYDSLYDAP